MSPISVVQLIRKAHPDLRKSERKVADYVLACPDDAIHMRIVDLAQEAHVSEPTVVRFCRAIGYNSFQSLKLALAQYVAHHPRPQLEQDGALAEGAAVIASAVGALQRLSRELNQETAETVSTLLATARRVDIYAQGAFAAVALDTQQRLRALGLNAMAVSDPHWQTLSSTSVEAGDVVLVLSGSGTDPILTTAAQQARAAGAHTVALAPPGTPLSISCDLTMAVPSTGSRAAALPARIALLTLLEILAAGCSQLLATAASPGAAPDCEY